MSRIIYSVLIGISIFQFSSASPGGSQCAYVQPSDGRIICRLRCIEECLYEFSDPDVSEHHCSQVIFEKDEVGIKSHYGCESGSNTFICEMQNHTETSIVIKFAHLGFEKVYTLSAPEVQNGLIQYVHEYKVYSCTFREELEIISSTSWRLTTRTTLRQTTSQTTRRTTSQATITTVAKVTSMSSSSMHSKILPILGIILMKLALF